MSLSNRGNTQYTADSSRMCSDGRGWVIMNVSMFHLLLPSTEYKGSDVTLLVLDSWIQKLPCPYLGSCWDHSIFWLSRVILNFNNFGVLSYFVSNKQKDFLSVFDLFSITYLSPSANGRSKLVQLATCVCVSQGGSPVPSSYSTAAIYTRGFYCWLVL